MVKNQLLYSDLPVIDGKTGWPDNPEVFQTGAIILIDKPVGWTSFDAVKFIRNRVPAKKVGHAGTLDPLATGLLILCTGKATKLISQIQDLPKTYRSVIRFGASTPSYDAATEPDEISGWDHISKAGFIEVLRDKFTGEIKQVPPVYSAKKVAGKRLYQYARKGEDVDIKARPVTIYGIELNEFDLPSVTVTVRCGKGTYIRSLAHDVGLALHSRAYLSSLRRTITGPYDVNDALEPKSFETLKPTVNNG